jgi:hypothetical protein
MSRERILMSLIFYTVILAHPAASLAAGETDPKPRVLVIDAIDLPERMEDTRAELRKLLDEAVRQHGFDLIRPEGAPSCADATCLPAVAKSTGATDILVTRGGRNGSHGYHVDLNLWSVASGSSLPAVADCTVCTGPQMAEAVARAAGPLLDSISARPPTAAPVPPPAAGPVPSNPAPVLGNPPGASATLEPHSGRRIAGWSLVGLGAASAAAGGILWNLDGKGIDCVGSSCRNTYRTEGEGIAFVAAGVVGIGVGLWLALDPFGKHDVAVGFGPSGASFSGRF